MARQAGPLYFTGTIDDLIFYKLGDKYFVRSKGEPTTGTKKQLKDPNCYPVLNMRKREFGEASEIAQTIYYKLPRKLRGHGKQQKLTGRVVRLMRKGMQEEEIIALLLEEMLGTAPATEPPSSIPSAACTVPENDSLQPARTGPKQQSKVKSAKKSVLSNWRVGDNGRLLKAPGVKQHTGNCYAQPVPINAQCCYPCTFYGLVPRPRDAGGG